mgnify:CR=1 FL=1
MNVRMNGICVNRYKQDRWLAYISPYLKLPLVICMNKKKRQTMELVNYFVLQEQFLFHWQLI